MLGTLYSNFSYDNGSGPQSIHQQIILSKHRHTHRNTQAHAPMCMHIFSHFLYTCTRHPPIHHHSLHLSLSLHLSPSLSLSFSFCRGAILRCQVAANVLAAGGGEARRFTLTAACNCAEHLLMNERAAHPTQRPFQAPADEKFNAPLTPTSPQPPPHPTLFRWHTCFCATLLSPGRIILREFQHGGGRIAENSWH